ncbi:hypothetical protein V8G54_033779 [Vigna mungo]|uniref:Uncharacterized protein n=1 Tax=Vigna mungo TaxID=3915 RepID=A0AAQ3RHX4_VIGMU
MFPSDNTCGTTSDPTVSSCTSCHPSVHEAPHTLSPSALRISRCSSEKNTSGHRPCTAVISFPHLHPKDPLCSSTALQNPNSSASLHLPLRSPPSHLSFLLAQTLPPTYPCTRMHILDSSLHTESRGALHRSEQESFRCRS